MQGTARRKASDLYALGVPLTIDDGGVDEVPRIGDVPRVDENGDPVLDDAGNPIVDQGQLYDELGNPIIDEVPLPPVTLWVSKLTDIDLTTVMKKATQAKSLALAGRKDRDSDNWKAMRALLGELDRDVWINTLLDHEHPEEEARALVEARVAGETVVDENGEEQPGEWAKDGYLEGLRDAWIGGLNIRYAADIADEDAVRVLGEITRFDKIVEDEYMFEREVERNVFESLSDETLLDKITDLMIEIEGESAYADEYRLRCIFLAARRCLGPDHSDVTGRKCLCSGDARKHWDYHFDSYDEVLHSDKRTRQLIYGVYNALTVDIREGKGLRVTRSFLQQFASPETEETSASFGLVDATA